MSSAVAAGGVFLLAILAPFETTTPLVRLPWQSLSNLEAALLLALAAWAFANALSRRMPSFRVPLAAASLTCLAVMAIAAFAAPEHRANALHMTGRAVAALAVYLLTVDGITNRSRLNLAVTLCVASGVAVALLAILEYVRVAPVLEWLRAFHAETTAVGAQVRAGGPLQYPTIASMYLEVAFALGLGLMLVAMDAASRVRTTIAFLALAAIGEAITLTYTRAGLITMAASLAVVGGMRWRERGRDGGVHLVVALGCVVAVLFATSRSTQSVWLRLTSEGQDAWYRARISAPADVTFDVDRAHYVTISIANAGRVVWNSDNDPPILFSYHWLDAEGDRVVAFEGGRTRFRDPVAPGETATVHALVRAPREPGVYQLQWDVVQEGRLWFSTEQGAPDPVVSRATVTGRGTGVPIATTARPRRAVRPGRLVLWGAAARMIEAHPLLGVGPDNFRLLYGRYAGLTGADPRTHTNNMYLEVLAGGGVLTFAAFAWLLCAAAALFATGVRPGSDPGPTPVAAGIAAAGVAIALHGLVDSFLGFAPTYILFSLTLGFAAARARGVETSADAHRV